MQIETISNPNYLQTHISPLSNIFATLKFFVTKIFRQVTIDFTELFSQTYFQHLGIELESQISIKISSNRNASLFLLTEK